MNKAMKHEKRKGEAELNYPFAELLVIASFFGLFVLAAVVSPVSIKDNVTSMTLWIVAAVLFFGVALLGTILTRKGHKLSISAVWIWPIIAGVVIAATRIPFISDAPLYWDSSFFYYAIDHAVQQFDFTLASFFELFKMGGHPSYGYASYLAIFHFGGPFSIENINIANIVVEATTACLLTKFAIDVLPKQPKFLCALLAISVCMTPLLFGTFSTVNLDRPMACFFIIALCLAHEKRYLLTGFMLLMIVGTKEPGFVFFSAFIFLILVASLIQAPKHKRLRSFAKSYCVRAMVLSVVGLLAFLAIDLTYQGPSFIWRGVPDLIQSFNTVEPPRFGFNIDNIIAYAKISFLLNFGWVFWAISICFLIFELIRHKWDKGVIGILRKNKALCSYLFGVFAVLIFSFAYITHANPRYLLCMQMTAIMLAGLFVMANVSNILIKSAYSALALVLCLVESFVTVDPITIKSFKNIGEPQGSQISCTETATFGLPDACVYNRQVMVYSDAIDEVLSKTGYDGSFTYVTALPSSALHIYYSLGGWYGDKSGTFVWDTQASRRVIATPSGGGVPINSLGYEDWYIAQTQGANDEKVVLIVSSLYDMDWGEVIKNDLNQLSEKYDMTQSGSAGYGAFQLDYYEFVLKE